MTKRETRVINAFVNCVRMGEFTEDYAVTLIEDNQRYGWLTDAAKESFYTAMDEMAAEKAAKEKATRTAAVMASDADEEEPVDEDEEEEAPEREVPLDETEATDSEE